MAFVSLVEDTPTFQKYIVEIYGEHRVSVTVTASPYDAERWINEHLRDFEAFNHVAGIGVECTHGSDGGVDRPADTLQICVDVNCLIFQLSRALHVPNNLRTFLNNPLHKLYGLWNGSDRHKLEISKHNLVMAKDPLDASLYAEAWEHFGEEVEVRNGTLNDFVEMCMGVDPIDLDIDAITKSDWRVERLSVPQISFATVDAYAAFYVGDNRELGLVNATRKRKRCS